MNVDAIFELADKLKELREAKKYAEQEIKEINEGIEKIDAQLAQLMIDTETQNFTRGGVMFCLNTTMRASAIAELKDDLFEALRAEGFGNLIYETVNANSLSAFVKEQISQNGDVLPSWLDGLLNLFEKTTVSVRKASK